MKKWHYKYNGIFEWNEISNVYDEDVVEYLVNRMKRRGRYGVKAWGIFIFSLLFLIWIGIKIFTIDYSEVWYMNGNELKTILILVWIISTIAIIVAFLWGLIRQAITGTEPVMLVAKGKLTDLKYVYEYWMGIPIIFHIPKRGLIGSDLSRLRLPKPYVNHFKAYWFERPTELYDMDWEERNDLFLGRDMLVFKMSNSNMLFVLFESDFDCLI